MSSEADILFDEIIQRGQQQPQPPQNDSQEVPIPSVPLCKSIPPWGMYEDSDMEVDDEKDNESEYDDPEFCNVVIGEGEDAVEQKVRRPDPNFCFMCQHFCKSQEDNVADWTSVYNQIEKFILDNHDKVTLKTLYRGIHSIYERIRINSVAFDLQNNQLLPEWRLESVIRHYNSHQHHSVIKTRQIYDMLNGAMKRVNARDPDMNLGYLSMVEKTAKVIISMGMASKHK